jgi:site-specific DNA-methyltransferase (adenine-specific)
MQHDKTRAPRNRTLTLSLEERQHYAPRLLRLEQPLSRDDLPQATLHQDMAQAVPLLPDAFVDLLILDPPYNLARDFGTVQFRPMQDDDYSAWIEGWFVPLLRLLKPHASLYVCADWRTSPLLYPMLSRHCIIRNRITWEREKGRGAKSNWKNTSEDIWYCTLSSTYTFNVEAVKLKRRVLAPYRDSSRRPKDWQAEGDGNYRLTHPSNLWTDISVPFWSMPENTDHPTQKPEKLLAKLILASSNPNDWVFDPFLGSGTTSVVAKKLGRRYLGIEIDETFACLAEKRLALAEDNPSIQGYQDGVFWERNATMSSSKATLAQKSLFAKSEADS